MFGFIEKTFIGLLTSVVINVSIHTKCVSLSNQKYEIQPALINLHRNEYSQELHYYPFTVKLERCVGICNTLNDLSNKVCVPNKTEACTMKCKCNFDGRKCNSIKNEITINVNASAKNITYVKKIM